MFFCDGISLKLVKRDQTILYRYAHSRNYMTHSYLCVLILMLIGKTHKHNLQVFMSAMVSLASIVVHRELTILAYVQSCMAPIRPQSRTYRHRLTAAMSAACVPSRKRMCGFSCKVPLGIVQIDLVGCTSAQSPDVVTPAAPTVSTTLVKYRHWNHRFHDICITGYTGGSQFAKWNNLQYSRWCTLCQIDDTVILVVYTRNDHCGMGFGVVGVGGACCNIRCPSKIHLKCKSKSRFKSDCITQMGDMHESIFTVFEFQMSFGGIFSIVKVL